MTFNGLVFHEWELVGFFFLSLLIFFLYIEASAYWFFLYHY